jgi:hypothetical protein
MPRAFVDRKGKTHHEGEAGYELAKIYDVEDTMRSLLWAIVDLQHRVAALDGKGVNCYPGDVYHPDERPPE